MWRAAADRGARRIETMVGAAYRRFYRFIAAAHGPADRESGRRLRLGVRLQYVGERCGRRIVRVIDQKQKLIAAHAHDDRLPGRMRTQEVRHADQHLIAALMTIGVVDLLETIQIDEDARP